MSHGSGDRSNTDAVVIGRNEGARLAACLRALRPKVRRLIYVDSGSSDGSPARAQELGAEVVELAPDRPFSAARARNAGLAALADNPPEFVQMADGDCIIADAWLADARAFMVTRPETAAVFGRTREQAPEASIYNRLQDHEWEMLVRHGRCFTGTFLGRYLALNDAGGFREDLIAGEEGELCNRLRQAGWQIVALGQDCALHDARIMGLPPFWRRAVRAGHSFAQVPHVLPGAYRPERLRAWLWAAVLPMLSVIAAVWAPPLVALVALLYFLSLLRNMIRFRRDGFAPQRALQAAALTVLSKFANLQGMLIWHGRRARGIAPRIIEYK